MLSALKRMDKKFLIMIAIILGLPIFIIIFLAIFQSCSNSKISYEEYEQKMISAAEKYFEDKEVSNLEEGTVLTVKLKKLVDGDYIKSTDALLSDKSCDGFVNVRKNGSLIKENDGGFLNYVVNLECDDYKTKTLNSSLMENLTTIESGLYKVGNAYVFRGNDVDNYINFFGTEYRIMGIDSDGTVKLLKSEEESLNKYWDVKYNTEVNSAFGKNIYKDSSMRDNLLNVYLNNKKVPPKARKHIVSKDLCVDSRSIEDLSITQNSPCTNVLKNEVISLLGVTDFAKASLDSECVNIKSKSCRNYNYLHALNLRTWTYVPVAENTYEVYYLSTGIINKEQANKYDSYNIVIHIDGNETYLSGNGSKNDPYVIN